MGVRGGLKFAFPAGFSSFFDRGGVGMEVGLGQLSLAPLRSATDVARTHGVSILYLLQFRVWSRTTSSLIFE